MYTWYTFAREILAEFDINEEDLFVLDKSFKLIKNPIKNSTKRVVKEKYEQIILEKLSNLDENSKLFLYNKLKNEIKLEDYLYTLKNFNSRKVLTKFRISDHKLEIEIGRYKKFQENKEFVKLAKYWMMRNICSCIVILIIIFETVWYKKLKTIILISISLTQSLNLKLF